MVDGDFRPALRLVKQPWEFSKHHRIHNAGTTGGKLAVQPQIAGCAAEESLSCSTILMSVSNRPEGKKALMVECDDAL